MIDVRMMNFNFEVFEKILEIKFHEKNGYYYFKNHISVKFTYFLIKKFSTIFSRCTTLRKKENKISLGCQTPRVQVKG